MNAEQLLAYYNGIAEVPDAIARLRGFIIDLAVCGKLVRQNPTDEPVAVAAVADRDLPKSLPRSWRYVRLELLLSENTRNGYSLRPDDAENGVPILRISAGTVRQDRLVAEEEHKLISGIDEATRLQYGLKCGDLLACRFNGNKAFVGRLTLFSDYLGLNPIYPDKLIRVRLNRQLVLPEFICIAGQSDLVRSAIEKFCATTVGNWGISASNLKEVHFPLPSLAEQHRIVAKVDKLMALCDRLEAARVEREAMRDRPAAASLARLNAPDPDPAIFATHARFALTNLPALTTRFDQIKELRQTIQNLAVRGKLVRQDPTDEPASELLRRIAGGWTPELRANKMLESLPEPSIGWDWALIDHCFQVTGGIQKTPARAPRGNAFPYLGVGNVYRNRLRLTDIKQFELVAGELERYCLKPNDIMVVEGNGSVTEIGRCAIWQAQIPNCVHQNHLIRCRPKEELLAPYIQIFLNSPDGMAAMKRLAITSAGLYSLSVGKIRQIPVPLPPLAEQRRIVAKVNVLMALCDRLEASLAEVDTTRLRLLGALLYETLLPAEVGHLEAAE